MRLLKKKTTVFFFENLTFNFDFIFIVLRQSIRMERNIIPIFISKSLFFCLFSIYWLPFIFIFSFILTVEWIKSGNNLWKWCKVFYRKFLWSSSFSIKIVSDGEDSFSGKFHLDFISPIFFLFLLLNTIKIKQKVTLEFSKNLVFFSDGKSIWGL